jgi:alpha-galactosidase/6-phospho-beta-glucosidase family protein
MNVAAPKVKSIGMYHSVQGTARQLAGYIGVPFAETGHWAAGVNHQAWYLRYDCKGQDAYPQLRECMSSPAIYAKDPVRFEIMKFVGYFPTESSVHHSEFYPYFWKNADLIVRFTPGYPSGVARNIEHISRLGDSRAAPAVKGGLEGDYRSIEQAIARDSLTGPMPTLDQIRDTVGEIFAAETKYLLQFKRTELGD